MVTDVALVPLSSQGEAENGVIAAVRQRETTADVDEDSSDAESEVDESNDVDSACDMQEVPSPTDDVRTKLDEDNGTATTNIAKDVFARRGPYGRFASQWLTKKGWSLPGMRAPGKVAETEPESTRTANSTLMEEPPANTVKDAASSPPAQDPSSEQAPGSRSPGKNENRNSPSERGATIPLLPKLLRSTRLILSSRSFYFSYDFNITRRMGGHGMFHSKPLAHEDVDPLVCQPASTVFCSLVPNSHSISGIES